MGRQADREGGEAGGRARGEIGGASGEMELGSLNMDVIFRAEQKERRDERANERTRIWDAERIGDRGWRWKEGWKGKASPEAGWILSIHLCGAPAIQN